ncbi:DUF6941 family protein [Chloroflexota bacterium]
MLDARWEYRNWRRKGHMHVDYAFICDYAEAKDKVNAIGIGFDRIYATKVPARHPHFSVVTQLKFSRTEAGIKDIQIHLIDADGNEIIPPINRKLQVKTPAGTLLETTARLVVEFGHVEFKIYGDYSVKVNIGTQEVVSIPLSIMQPPITA